MVRQQEPEPGRGDARGPDGAARDRRAPRPLRRRLHRPGAGALLHPRRAPGDRPGAVRRRDDRPAVLPGPPGGDAGRGDARGRAGRLPVHGDRRARGAPADGPAGVPADRRRAEQHVGRLRPPGDPEAPPAARVRPELRAGAHGFPHAPGRLSRRPSARRRGVLPGRWRGAGDAGRAEGVRAEPGRRVDGHRWSGSPSTTPPRSKDAERSRRTPCSPAPWRPPTPTRPRASAR